VNRTQLEELEVALTDLVNDRRSLGDFDTNALTIRMMAEALLLLTRHLREQTPRKKKRDTKS
jgi:hypothetical protein